MRRLWRRIPSEGTPDLAMAREIVMAQIVSELSIYLAQQNQGNDYWENYADESSDTLELYFKIAPPPNSDQKLLQQYRACKAYVAREILAETPRQNLDVIIHSIMKIHIRVVMFFSFFIHCLEYVYVKIKNAIVLQKIMVCNVILNEIGRIERSIATIKQCMKASTRRSLTPRSRGQNTPTQQKLTETGKPGDYFLFKTNANCPKTHKIKFSIKHDI